MKTKEVQIKQMLEKLTDEMRNLRDIKAGNKDYTEYVHYRSMVELLDLIEFRVDSIFNHSEYKPVLNLGAFAGHGFTTDNRLYEGYQIDGIVTYYYVDDKIELIQEDI